MAVQRICWPPCPLRVSQPRRGRGTHPVEQVVQLALPNLIGQVAHVQPWHESYLRAIRCACTVVLDRRGWGTKDCNALSWMKLQKGLKLLAQVSASGAGSGIVASWLLADGHGKRRDCSCMPSAGYGIANACAPQPGSTFQYQHQLLPTLLSPPLRSWSKHIFEPNSAQIPGTALLAAPCTLECVTLIDIDQP